MKGLINHTPTDDDITNILKEFTVDFLLKSYGLLVEDLHDQLMMTEVARGLFAKTALGKFYKHTLFF